MNAYIRGLFIFFCLNLILSIVVNVNENVITVSIWAVTAVLSVLYMYMGEKLFQKEIKNDY